MVKRIMLVVVCVFLLTGCNNDQRMTATALSGGNTDLSARIGVRTGDTEIGGLIKYVAKDDIEWGPEPDFGGGYILFYLSQDVTIEDTPQSSILQPWLEALHAQPYAGLELVAACDTQSANDVQPNWIVGTRFTMTEDASAALVVEYIDGDQAAGDLFLGFSYLF